VQVVEDSELDQVVNALESLQQAEPTLLVNVLDAYSRSVLALLQVLVCTLTVYAAYAQLQCMLLRHQDNLQQTALISC
jgi:hypothetical protein